MGGHECVEFGRKAVARDLPVMFAPLTVDRRYVRLAQPRRRLDQRVEHRLQIERRAADDLEHVGGGGLLLQRFAQLVEQAGVLDGDDGLGGEVRDQLDLLVGERAHLLAVDGDGADQLSSLSIGTARKVRAPARSTSRDGRWIAVGVGRLAPRSAMWTVRLVPATRPSAVRGIGAGSRPAPPLLGECRRGAVQRDVAECSPS